MKAGREVLAFGPHPGSGGGARCLAPVATVCPPCFHRALEPFREAEECLLAAVDALVEPTITMMEEAEDAPTGEARVRQAVEALPRPGRRPAGRLEDVLHRGLRGRAGGRGGGRADDRPLRALRGQPAQRDPRPQGDAAADGAGDARRPAEGDPQAPLQRRSQGAAAAGRGDRRPGALSYPPPPGPARGRRSGAAARRSPSPSARRSPTRPSGCCGRWRRSSPRRATRGPRVAEVVERAGTSQRVFYGHFENKEEAFLAALDSGSAQMLGLVLPAFRRANSWQESVRAAYEAMFSFGIEEPEYTTPRRGRDVHGRPAGAADPRHRHGRPRGAAGARLRAGAGHPADRGRGDRRRDLRADLRPGQEQRAPRACPNSRRWPPT